MTTYTDTVNKDLKYGNKKEKQMLPILVKYFKANLTKTNDYNEFDYIDTSKKIKIELKSRRTTLKQYPTTIVGHNKFKEGYKNILDGYKIYFVFVFACGTTAYYQLAENKFEIKEGGRQDRGKEEIKKYVYIPTDELKFIVKDKNNISNISSMTDDNKGQTKLSYSKRLINAFVEEEKDIFSLSEIETLVKRFGRLEYEKLKTNTDEMPFGQYKGKKIAYIAEFDTQYLYWVLGNEALLKKYKGLEEEIKKNTVSDVR